MFLSSVIRATNLRIDQALLKFGNISVIMLERHKFVILGAYDGLPKSQFINSSFLNHVNLDERLVSVFFEGMSS